MTAVRLRGLPNDIYLQIGLLTTIGLSTKNAILIIQFTKDQLRQGHELVEATLAAVRIRLRPILMTSLAFFFGTLPLALSHGAGAAAQNAIGTAVTGGLLSATFIDMMFIPFFFVLVFRPFVKEHRREPAPQPGVVRYCPGGETDMRSFKRLAALCLALAAFFWLSGCATMAPKYSRPASPVPDAWPSGPSYKETAGKTPEKRWPTSPGKNFSSTRICAS